MGFEVIRVQRFQVFVDVAPAALEQTLQEWLAANHSCRIAHMTQSQNAAGLVTLTLLYSRP